ncbi:MAG: NAD(P)/FAD-dependent oxidoreductase [Dehalococcoidia bacterium]
MRIVIIGGGVAGLGAAWELVNAGHEVRLYEAGPTLGGQVRTFEVGGGRLEVFYHHLFRSDTEAIATIEALGLGPDLEWIESKVAMVAGGRIYPFVGAADLLRFTRVSFLTRLRLGLAALWLRRKTDWPSFEGKRARDWIVRWTGREGYEGVWGPLLRAKFGERADDVSLVWFWGKIHLRFASRPGGLLAKEQLGYLRGSFGRLVDALVEASRARGATLEAGRPVARVVVEDGRAVGVELAPAEGGPAELVPADAVIATVPSYAFQRLVPDLDPAYNALLEAVEYEWATVLVLTLDRPLSRHYWLTMTDDDSPFVVAVEQTNFVPPERYGGNHVVYFSNYCPPHDPTVEESAEQTFERYLPFIRRINPDFDPSWVRERWLFKDRAGQPVVDYRYHERIAPHRTPIEGLYLANTTQVYPEDRGQNYSIRMGRRVARLVLASEVEAARHDPSEAPAESAPSP